MYNLLDINKLQAYDFVNNYSDKELSRIFRKLGEEKLHQEIAEAIVKYRKEKEIVTTKELSQIIISVYQHRLNTDKEVPWVGKRHPATKVFQALRIEVNGELDVLKEVLPQATELLAPQGRLAVITFHSLEDRIVKRFFQDLDTKEFKIITKKPLRAAPQELSDNNRARSAKLRVVEKI